MAEDDATRIVITKPGVLALGVGLPAGPSIESFFQDETVVQVSCGVDHSAVVCASGRVYTFGKNQDNGWLKNDGDQIAQPRLVTTLSSVSITQAACGRGYTVLLTDKGELYSCGSNDQGQLGLGHTNKAPTPVLVAGLPPIKKVAAEWLHTVVLADSGEIWVCGHNQYGQLGLGHTNQQTSFTSVPNLPEAIIDISCGGQHTALVSASRALLIAGWNKHGQLGLDVAETLSSFTRVSTPSSAVAAVSCGYKHTVVLRVDGTTWAWGNNGNSQLGTGDTDKRFAPTIMIGLEDQTVSQVIAGCYHTAVLTQEGDVFVCGSGLNGQLGPRKENVSVATRLPKSPGVIVQQVAFAEKYSLLLVVEKANITPAPQLEIGVAETGDLVRNGTTELERNFMTLLECPVCFKVMCAPIHQCSEGHSLCNTCRSDDRTTVCPLCRGQFSTVRNLLAERLSAKIELPCMACLLRMPACELERHGAVCPRRDYDCPLACGGWKGRPEAMLGHALSAHADRTWPDLPRTFVQRRGLLLTDVLGAHGRVFTLHRVYDGDGTTFRAAVRYIGTPEDRHAFTFEFTLLSEDMSTIYRRNICSDIENVEDMFHSSNCVSVKGDFLDTFLQNGDLTFRVAILKV